MVRTNLFLNNRTQAVRLPRDVSFPDTVHEVAIIRDGNRRVITPVGEMWDDFFALGGVDFGERPAASHQERETF